MLCKCQRAERAEVPWIAPLLIARSAVVTCMQGVPAGKRPSLSSLDSLEKAPPSGGITRFFLSATEVQHSLSNIAVSRMHVVHTRACQGHARLI